MWLTWPEPYVRPKRKARYVPLETLGPLRDEYHYGEIGNAASGPLTDRAEGTISTVDIKPFFKDSYLTYVSH